jgi:hypothetical protein
MTDTLKGTAMANKPIYGYSNPKLSKPDLRLTIKLVNGSEIWLTRSRIDGTADDTRDCWLSGVDYWLYRTAAAKLFGEIARTHPRSMESRPRKLVYLDEYVLAQGAVDIDAPLWLPPGDLQRPRRRRRRRPPLRLVSKPSA